MQRIIKSVFWLVGCSTVGFVLLQATQPSEQTVSQISRISPYSKEQNQKAQLLMDRLKEASQQK